MNKYLRVLVIFFICAVMSLPFVYLLWWNMTPGPMPYGREHTDGNFVLADVAFYIQHVISLIVLFLLYVKSINEENEPHALFGITAGVIGVLSLVGSFMLTWKGEIVNVSLRQSNSFAYLISHKDMAQPVFYGALTAIWLGIMTGTIAALSGKIKD